MNMEEVKAEVVKIAHAVLSNQEIPDNFHVDITPDNLPANWVLVEARNIKFIDNNSGAFGSFERKIQVTVYKKDENKQVKLMLNSPLYLDEKGQ